MTIEIGLLFTVISLIIAAFGYQLNKHKQQLEQQKEIKLDSQQDARIQAQLDYIGKGVDDIRIDLKASEKERIALGERVTRVEESTKQAHKRIDFIENKEEK
ncbi:hypothetical protein [Schinkia azotoformans]|uniref:hypothetical protein n=1 Tax=Schinkia azotoformans TaxID=1454 RepID=UPI002DBEA56F|nr:hypothetical protein [Schinkia azotoformans]MEC1716585.1 hypothetical protein [Schinkia azotoformans]MEC1739423.1 hypothetical protein [Schinkia azotoformans]MEC1745507.1 hypothetical protein [Schinkia azotoformans]MEC1756570.1 hypothetical protein [Schinkia azotoformans]MEC1765837.1 hypothetical protein [Schinkia azotoformans]